MQNLPSDVQQFRVRFVRAGDTKVREEFVVQTNADEVHAKLTNDGYTVLSVKAQGQASKLGLADFFHRRARDRVTLDRQSYALFCKEIRTLMRAGMTVVEAVDTLSTRDQGSGLASVLLRRLEKGISLSSALDEMDKTPAVLVAAVRSGERMH